MTKEQVTGQRADGLVRQAEQTVCDPLCFTASSALVLFARAQSCSSLNPRPHGKRSDCPPRASACPLRATHTLAQSHPPFSPRARQLTRPTPLPRLGLQLVETQTYRTRTRTRTQGYLHQILDTSPCRRASTTRPQRSKGSLFFDIVFKMNERTDAYACADGYCTCSASTASA